MTIQDEVRQRIENDALLARLRRKIESGKGTFADSFAYSDRAGKLLGDIFSRRLPDIPLEEREALCVELLRDRYTDINELCDRVQKALDEAQGLHLAPQHAPYNEERAHQIGSSLRDLSKPEETLQRRAESAPATATRAMHDDRMKAESKFRSRAGLKCTVNRVAAFQCCEWCDRVAGKYEYDDTPDDLWRRHDNCNCTIVYGTRRDRQVLRGTEKKWEIVAEGVGAPEPVRLTPEQARKLQAKKQLNYLTGGVKHGKLNVEEKQFLDRILADPDMSPEYRQILMDRFCSGSEIAQKSFAKYVQNDSVANKNLDSHKVPHHFKGKIYMNYTDDETDEIAPGSTWFHEHGHLIDYIAGRPSKQIEFYDALRNDFAKLITSRTGSQKKLTYTEAMDFLAVNPQLCKVIGDELKTSVFQQAIVSDIMNGVSVGMIRGCGWHPNDYWNGDTIRFDSFANMYEAQFDELSLKQINMYFPNALDVFEKILKGV